MNEEQIKIIKKHLKNKEPLFDEWYIVECIGTGKSGCVFEAQSHGGKKRSAIKTVLFGNDIQGHRDLSHHLSRMYIIKEKIAGTHNCQPIKKIDYIETEDYLVYFELQSLMTPLKDYLALNGMDEETLKKIGMDISSGLIELEERDIIHRDIKLQNILFDKDHFYITDFDSAILSSDSNENVEGTYEYMAPELFKKDPVFSHKTDIYSLGITLYKLMNGGHLLINGNAFAESNYDKMTFVRNRKSGLRLEKPILANEALFEIVEKAANTNPGNRYNNAKEIYDEIIQIDVKNRKDCKLNHFDCEKTQIINNTNWNNHFEQTAPLDISNDYVFIEDRQILFSDEDDISKTLILRNDKPHVGGIYRWLFTTVLFAFIPLLLSFIIRLFYAEDQVANFESYVPELFLISITLIVASMTDIFESDNSLMSLIQHSTSIVVLLISGTCYSILLLKDYMHETEKINYTKQFYIAVTLIAVSIVNGVVIHAKKGEK